MIAIPLVFAFLFYLVAYGWRTLDPYYFNWLMDKDPTIHFLGWAMYRQTPLQFPLALTPNLMTPIGSSTINTDSIPLLAAILKAVLGPGEAFQFTGIWLLFCYLMQALLSFKILKMLTKDGVYSALGSLLFIASPILLFRYEHKALCAHWMLLWGIYLYFRSNEMKRIPYLSTLALNVIAVGVHPYLFPMVLSISLAIHWNKLRSDSRLSQIAKSAGQMASYFFASVLLMYCLGYFTLSNPGSWGFNTFSADLLALISSQHRATLVPYLRFSSSQREGFGYLGAGLIAALFFLGYLWRKGRVGSLAGTLKGTLPLWVIGGLGFFFSLSGHITFAGNPIIHLDWFYALFGPLTEILRAPGRFLWVLYYTLMLALCILPFLYFKGRKRYLVLSGILVLQAADLGPWFIDRSERAPLETTATGLLKDPFWNRMRERGFAKLHLIPPAQVGEKFGCEEGTYSPSEVQAFWLKAAINKMSFNSALVARAPKDAILIYCDRFWGDLATDNLTSTVFVVSNKKDYWVHFQKSAGDKLNAFECVKRDDFHVCAPKTAI